MVVVGLVLLFGGGWIGWNFPSANLAVVDIDLLWITIEGVSVWKLVLGAFALGAGLVLLAAAFFYMRGVILRRRYRATIRRLESELHQMRSLPLSDAGASTPGEALPAEATPARSAAGGG